MSAEWLDESDCVGAWQNENMAAVLFPTAATLPQVRQLTRVKGPQRLTLVINPQWQMDGQIVSDFGYAAVPFAHCLYSMAEITDAADVTFAYCLTTKDEVVAAAVTYKAVGHQWCNVKLRTAMTTNFFMKSFHARFS